MLNQGILPLLPTAKEDLDTFTPDEINSLLETELRGLLAAPDGTDLSLVAVPQGSKYLIRFLHPRTGYMSLGNFVLTGDVYIFNVDYAPYPYVTLKTDYNNSSNSWEKVLRLLEYYPADLVIYGANPNANYCYNIISESLGLPINPTTANPVYEFTLLLNSNTWLAKDFVDIYTGANTNGLISATVRGKVTRKQLTTISKEELTLAGQPVVSHGADENGKYVMIKVPNSPINNPSGNIYRNGGDIPVGRYISMGLKTAKWYITDSPIGGDGDAYTANQVYNDGVSVLYSLISNTTLIDWTTFQWTVESVNQSIIITETEIGAIKEIKFYKNEKLVYTVMHPNTIYVFDATETGGGEYKIEISVNTGYKTGDGIHTKYITLATQTLNVQTEFNEINGELSAENQYLKQMNVTPNTGWTRKDYRTVVINESGTYSITLESNDPLWITLIPVPATYDITAALDTPVLNIEMSNQLDLIWDETDFTTYYEIYQNGELIDSVPSESSNILMARSVENKKRKKKWVNNV